MKAEECMTYSRTVVGGVALGGGLALAGVAPYGAGRGAYARVFQERRKYRWCWSIEGRCGTVSLFSSLGNPTHFP